MPAGMGVVAAKAKMKQELYQKFYQAFRNRAKHPNNQLSTFQDQELKDLAKDLSEIAEPLLQWVLEMKITYDQNGLVAPNGPVTGLFNHTIS